VHTKYAWWSSGALEEHTVRWAPTSLARNFLWNGFASGMKWKVGDPLTVDRRIRFRHAFNENRKTNEYK
jgi:hypothetical protein